MQLQLAPHWTKKLAGLPESGMGYQRVHLRLKAGHEIENALVFNAQVLEVPDTAPKFSPDDIVAIELAADPTP